MRAFGLELKKETFVPYLLAIGALLVSFGLVVLVVFPRVTKFSDLRQKRDSEIQRYEKLKTKSEQLSQLLKSRTVLEADVELFENAVPSEANVPVLMTQVETMATDSGTLIDALQFSKRGGTRSEKGTEKEKDYEPVELKASLEGDYAELLTFLKILENASRVVTVEDLRFTKAVAEGGKTVTKELLANFGLSSYYSEYEPKIVPEAPLGFSLENEKYLAIKRELEMMRVYKVKIDTTGVGKANPFD